VNHGRSRTLSTLGLVAVLALLTVLTIVRFDNSDVAASRDATSTPDSEPDLTRPPRPSGGASWLGPAIPAGRANSAFSRFDREAGIAFDASVRVPAPLDSRDEAAPERLRVVTDFIAMLRTRIERVTHERQAARVAGATSTTQLDERILYLQQHLETATFAQHAINSEMPLAGTSDEERARFAAPVAQGDVQPSANEQLTDSEISGSDLNVGSEPDVDAERDRESLTPASTADAGPGL